MATATRVTVDTTGGGTQIYSNSGGRSKSVIIRNRGSVALYVGESALTTSTGYQIDAGESLSLILPAGGRLYGITASSSDAVHVLAEDV